MLKGAAVLGRTSAMSKTVCTVWGVSGILVFPCAEGAAPDVVTEYATKRIGPVDGLRTTQGSKSEDPRCGSDGSGSAASRSSATSGRLLGTIFLLVVPLNSLGGLEPVVHHAVRPGKTLHVLSLGRRPRARNSWRP